MPIEFLIYGEGEAINHLRVLIQAEDEADASRIVDANITLWREAISVTSVMATAHYAAAATLGAHSSIHPVMFGEGGKDTPLAGLTLQWAKPATPDYNGAAALMAAWPVKLRHHLYFLAMFLNPNLPASVRWHQGYRFLEWHFERGSTKLARNTSFCAFVERHAGALDQLKPQNRTRVGFLEEIRATVAHALLADRPTDGDRLRIEHAVTNTFAALETMVMAVLNEVPLPGIQFRPKLPPNQRQSPPARNADVVDMPGLSAQ